MVGGIPEYLCMFHERFSLEENVRATFLNPSSILFEEPFLILKQEVREPSLYNAILSAIANGATKLSEIAAVIGEETSVAAAYLKNLALMEIVSKETPATENTAKKTIYRISDSVFRFWYRFLPDVLSEIQQIRPDLAYRKIEPLLTDYMGEVFEEICRQYLSGLSDSGKTPFPLKSIGRWWGMDPFTREKLQVPILASDEHNSMLFGTCKWSSEKMDVAELTHLIEMSEFFSCQEQHFYLFSKSGFTRTCQDTAEQLSNVTLVSFSK
jgi:AAA+ ATPase superfamily predicted ATPase